MNAIREYWSAADAPCASLAETAPGMAEVRAERWCSALSAFAFAATLDIGRTAQAYTAWMRGARCVEGARFIADTLGTACSMSKLYGRPGAAAFAGVARAEFTDDIWQELPPGEGTPVVTIPILKPGIAYTETPLLVAVDVIAVEPVSGRCGSLADLHNGLLGIVPEDSSVSIRLHRRPLDWLAAGGSSIALLGAWPPAVCILDNGADAVEALLLSGRPIIADDDASAAELDRMQAQMREQMIARLPAPGALYVAANNGN